jgi:16S rRNA (cytidine1402-2'-O)-methyltransferase
MNGQLFVIGTPIGNLEDITLRAIKTLNEVSIIACENIPRTRILLSHLDIRHKKLIECSPSNEQNSALGIISLLEQGESVALVSDAGTPSVSDPGVRVVKSVSEAGFNVIPIPGVSALTTILSVAGIGGENVVFTGFLSKKEGQITKTLQEFAHKNNVLVVFVSCHRIKKFLKILKELSISADICLGKELTKSYEKIYRGSAEEIDTLLLEQEVKGEFVIVIRFLEEIPCLDKESSFSKKEKRKQKQLKKILENETGIV